MILNNGAEDPFIAAMKEQWRLEELAKNEKISAVPAKPKPKGKPKYKASTAFRSNKFLGRIFSDAAKNLKPDRLPVSNYRRFLEASYREALQKQLKVRGRAGRRVAGGVGRVRYTNLGYASGYLRDNIAVEGKVFFHHNPRQGRMYIDYELKQVHEGNTQYGDYIAGGRRAGKIPVKSLINWIEAKIALGSFKIYQVKKDKSRTVGAKARERKKTILSIAIAISTAASMAPKPPVIKDWNSFDDNPKLRKTFFALTKDDGAKYRRAIRDSIIKNATIDYGRI